MASSHPTETTRKGLPPEAYAVIPGDDYPPYVAAETEMAEFTFKAVLLGIVVPAEAVDVAPLNWTTVVVVGAVGEKTKSAVGAPAPTPVTVTAIVIVLVALVLLVTVSDTLKIPAAWNL